MDGEVSRQAQDLEPFEPGAAWVLPAHWRSHGCLYCGDKATQREHVFPRCFSGERTPKVPACQDCNGAAGGKIFDSLYHKAHWLATRLERKVAKLVRKPLVAIDSETGPFLRHAILRERDKREHLAWRLAHARRWLDTREGDFRLEQMHEWRSLQNENRQKSH